MPILFLIFILVLFKSYGCRPLILFRYFSDAIDVGKVKKKKQRNINNYCVPILSEDKKQSIKRIVSLQISGQYIISTTMLRDGNILSDWQFLSLPDNMNKFNLNDVYNCVAKLVKKLPESDVYLIENFIKMPNNVNVAGANLFYVRLQTLSMLIALINSGNKENSSNETEHSNKVILMKARLQARLFRIIVGSEVISSQDITELMFKGTFPDYVTPVIPAIDATLTYRSTKEPLIKEFMSNGLMLAMTFIDLVLNSNSNTIQALNVSSRRKLKTTDV
ncbi:Hypothetical protein CINCED_3A007903 [Cinara cedri]|uniref:Uncharacterized protein n=1 Tax=Cinara cedri TaxID=506608 RepID=A0A5E4M0R9_9HEMI|nr:Hypothetical protein CINCED_3A007903 [Cinara cedri]